MLRVLKAEVQAPALFDIYSPFWIHCDEGLVHQILAFESLNDAQFTLSTLLILFHTTVFIFNLTHSLPLVAKKIPPKMQILFCIIFLSQRKNSAVQKFCQRGFP